MNDQIFKVKEENCVEHSLIDMCRFYNGRSAWGTKICQKCGAELNWQSDYVTSNVDGHEARPY